MSSNNKKTNPKSKAESKASDITKEQEAQTKQQVLTVANAINNLSNRLTQVEIKLAQVEILNQKLAAKVEIEEKGRDLLHREIDLINKQLE